MCSNAYHFKSQAVSLVEVSIHRESVHSGHILYTARNLRVSHKMATLFIVKQFACI